MIPEIRGGFWEVRKNRIYHNEEILATEEILQSLGFTLLPDGKTQLGTPNPLPCRFEGHRINETLTRSVDIESFWICKFTVSNIQFEDFNPKRLRPPTSLNDTQPATNVTYLNALRYAEWMSTKYNLNFSIPTEPEWVYAAAPHAWEFPYHKEKHSQASNAHNFVFGESDYQTINVDDMRYGTNVWGLYHMGGNIQEFTLGSYYTDTGHWGSLTDGRYCIVKGGDFGHCPLSSGIQRRGIQDVSARSERVGFRLMHPNLRKDAT